MPRHWVHRAANAEVLLTSYYQRDEKSFVLGAQLPRAHALFGATMNRHDPLLFVEAARQAGLIVGHLGFAVPLEYQFVMGKLDYEVVPEALRLTDEPAHIVLELELSDVQWRGQTFTGARAEITGFRGGDLVGRSTIPFRCISPAAYARLRPPIQSPGDLARSVSQQHDPLPPQQVGRAQPHDVVLADTETDQVWHLRLDHTHPVLFDHPVDHVPGMAMMEAARQAAQCLATTEIAFPRGMRACFHRYVELDQVCLVRTDPTASTPSRVRIIAEQDDRIAAEFWVDATRR